MQWYRVGIIDHKGRTLFAGDCSPSSVPGQLRELERKLDGIRSGSPAFAFASKIIDPETARVFAELDGEPERITQEDADLLAELGEE